MNLSMPKISIDRVHFLFQIIAIEMTTIVLHSKKIQESSRKKELYLKNPQSFQRSFWCLFPECFVISNPVSYKHLEISNASVLATICDKFHQICVNNIRIDHKRGVQVRGI